MNDFKRTMRAVMTAALLAPMAVCIQGSYAQEGELNYDPDIHGIPFAGQHTETIVDLGTDPGGITDISVTSDCDPCYLGYGDERYDFTLTAPMDVFIEVNDCCIEGDRYEGRVNERDIDADGDGDPNNHEEDCIIGREEVNVAVGVFADCGTVTLAPGNWTIRIRDIQFQCGDFNPGCAAGYTVRLTFSAPTDTPCATLAPCFNPANPVDVGPECADEAFGPSSIPTVSEWGLIVLALLLLAAGTVVIRRTMATTPVAAG